MLIILAAELAGILLGIIAGILPGIHPNLIATTVIAIYEAGNLSMLTPEIASIIIFSMALTNIFIAFIPSTYLGVPDSDTAASILPAHHYLKQGKGHEAVMIMLIGSLAAILLTIATLPLFTLLIKTIYPFLKVHIPILLIIIALALILREEKKFFAIYTFLASGVLGILTLGGSIKNPLLPLLTGLFGLPSLLSSLNNKEQPQDQQVTFPPLQKKQYTKSILAAVTTGSFFSFLPSLSPSQAAIFTSLLTKDQSKEGYLIMTGALNATSMIISLITLYTINKSRSGVIAAMADLLPTRSLTTLLLYLAITLTLCFPICALTIIISKKFSAMIKKVNYQTLSWCILITIIAITAFLSGIKGLLVLLTATAIGIVPLLAGTSRNHLMGCLMISTMLWYII